MVQKERLASARDDYGPKQRTNHEVIVRMQEAFYGKELILADRDMVETESDEIIRNADKEDISLLVVGDPFGCDTLLQSVFLNPPLNAFLLKQCNDAYRHHPPSP